MTPPEMRVPGAQSRPEAGSDALNKPLRSAEQAAFDIALTALNRIARNCGGLAGGLADQALADIATLLPKRAAP